MFKPISNTENLSPTAFCLSYQPSSANKSKWQIKNILRTMCQMRGQIIRFTFFQQLKSRDVRSSSVKKLGRTRGIAQKIFRIQSKKFHTTIFLSFSHECVLHSTPFLSQGPISFTLQLQHSDLLSQ